MNALTIPATLAAIALVVVSVATRNVEPIGGNSNTLEAIEVVNNL